MNSLFKFPRRVRIHGGECGAVARALHHKAQKVALTQNEQSLISDEKALLRQAVFKKSLKTTFIERKQMSTKTLRKRIALVAVSALGFGLMSIVPASAATRTCTAATGGLTIQAGVSSTFGTCTISAAAVAGTDDISVQAPTGPEAGVVTFTALGAGTLATSNTRVVAAAAAVAPVTGADSGTGALNVVGSIDMPGVYTLVFGGAAAVTVTVVAGSSTTTSLTATTGNSGFFVTGATPVITVSRNTGGVLADGTILGIVTASPDAARTVGEVIGEAIETTIAVTTSSNARVFTFDNTHDVAGTYSFTFFNDTNANSALDSGEVSTTGSFTIGAAAAATSSITASLSRTIGNTSAGLSSVTVTATITDVDGNPTTGDLLVAETNSLGAGVSTLTSGVTNNSLAGFTTASPTALGSGTAMARVGTTNTYTATFTIDANADAAGDFVDTYLTVYIHTTLASTATGSAKKALRITKLGELTTVAGVATTAITDVVGIGSYSATTGLRDAISTTDLVTDIAVTVDRTVLTHTFTFVGAVGDEGEYLKIAVAPLAETSSTVVAPVTTLVAIGADLTAQYAVTTTAPAVADGYTLTVTDGSGDNVVATITFATAAPAWSVSPASFKAKFGDTSTITGTLSDNFGRILGAKAVYVSVTGRQAGIYNGTTAADGTYAFTWTDASAATTVTLTDVLTFNYNYFASAASTSTTLATSASRTVTYSATGVAVGSITVGAPSATATRPIDMDASVGLPAATSRVTYTASVKDAAGLPVASGALVTFTGGADDLFYGGTTGVTDAFGQASVVVYRTKVGAPAIKATAGGVTSAASAAVQWTNDVLDGDVTTAAPNASSANRQARYITLTADNASVVSEGIIRFTAKVTDRWGNAVDSAQVTFSETGAGRFFNPPTSNQVNTNAAGEASIDLNSQAGETGAVSVTATITQSTALQAINEDSAGFITNITETGGTFTGTLTAVAGVTAAVKTATATATITKDTSVSTADALLELAKAIGTGKSVEEAADAAAEAIDAANAATDAANLAAEAADAATVAAEEARDAADAATAAVEELATQVASLMSALKAQLTTLANTVAKIAKKVKA